MTALSRRAALLSGLALAACRAHAEPEPGPLPPLKTAAPFPVGVAGMTEQFSDLGWSELVTAQFDRVSAEWEMKMEALLKPDGGYDWTRPDAFMDWAERRGLSVFGHTLVWYSQKAPYFEALAADPRRFADAYARYIADVAGRYRGRLAGWDVVNEAVAEDGEGYRDCTWRQMLGMDYVRLAFEHARAADPQAVLFLNDYNLEALPKKRASFLRLAESVLKSGAPLGGLATQTHLTADVAPGAIKAAIADLGSLGLPVHVSELDISLNVPLAAVRGGDLERRQAALAAETVEALMELPPAQRFGLTIWGARDRDSWLRRPPNAGASPDRPLLFDDAGRPKPVTRAFVGAMQA